VGAVVIFVLAGVLFGFVFADFFAKAPSAELAGVAKDSISYPVIAAADLLYAGLLAFILASLPGRSTFRRGALFGCIIGTAVVLHFDLLSAATTNLTTPASVAVNAAVSGFMSAIGGGVIGLILGRLQER
jgi:uncharacterized membrane protein